MSDDVMCFSLFYLYIQMLKGFLALFHAFFTALNKRKK
tara:strand:- start:12911 stop:13024 length:114 start_codon:yes stop_codon:yes gene_type:complete